MKKIKYLCLLIFLATFNPTLSKAVFSLNTYYLLLDDQNRNTNLTVFNNGQEGRNYEVKLTHAKQNLDGSYTPLKEEGNGVKFADPYVLYSPIKFFVDKGSSQTIRLQKRPMAEAANGEYVSFLLIRELPNTPNPENPDNKPLVDPKAKKQRVQLTLTPIFGISLPLVVRKGALVNSASIQDIKVTHFDNKTSHLEVAIARSGTKSTRGDLIVSINNKKIAELKGINIFVGNPYRNVLFNIKNDILNQYKGKGVLSVKYMDPDTRRVLASQNLNL